MNIHDYMIQHLNLVQILKVYKKNYFIHVFLFTLFLVTDSTLIPNRVNNESQFDLNGNHRLSEHQRLLYAES